MENYTPNFTIHVGGLINKHGLRLISYDTGHDKPFITRFDGQTLQVRYSAKELRDFYGVTQVINYTLNSYSVNALINTRGRNNSNFSLSGWIVENWRRSGRPGEPLGSFAHRVGLSLIIGK